MQPFAKNMAVEYAAKALPDSELAKALKDLQDGKTTIEEVTALIEGGTVSNAKPIYYHPIFVRDNTSNRWSRLTFVLIDNQPEQYTFATFKEKVKSMMDSGASIQTNGVFTGSQIGGAPCQAFILIKDSATYRIYGYNEESNNQYYINLDDLTATVFEDGVNKIN